MRWTQLSKYRLEIMGFATLFVVFFHFHEAVSDYDMAFGSLILKAINRLGTHGNIGVEIFLILSGVGCAFSLHKNNHTLFFYKKRLMRIIFPYLLVAIPFWLVNTFIIDKTSWKDFFFNLFGISFFTDGVTTFWYIFFILLMYFFVPFIYSFFAPAKTRFLRFIFLEILVCAFNVLGYWILGKTFVSYEIFFTRIPVFLLGVYAGQSVLDDKKMHPLFIVICTLFFGSLFIEIEYPVFLVKRFFAMFQGMGIIIVFIAVYSILQNEPTRQVLDWFGKHSLEIYLLHIAFRRIFLDLKILQRQPYFYLVIILLSMLFSLVISKICDIINYKLRKLL